MTIKEIKDTFIEGTQIVLDYMDDEQAPPKGTKGIVKYVDGIGNVHVNWENGSTLALLPNFDKYHFV